MDISDIDVEDVFCALQHAFYELSTRGLVCSARWVADVLNGLGISAERADELTDGVVPPRLRRTTMRAKAYFDSNEFLRAWNSLKDVDAPTSAEKFLRAFARYHAGEAIKEDAMGTEIFVDRTKEQPAKTPALNPYLEELTAELEGATDPYLQYLLGVVLRARSQQPGAVSALIDSVTAAPFNWSAWLELRACFSKLAETQAILDTLAARFATQPATNRVMLVIFRCFASEELDPVYAADLLEHTLLPIFPDFESLHTQLARLASVDGQYDKSVAIFEGVLARDPYRIEDLDVYSNLLYVNEQRSKLAFLAQHVATTDKYRTESCCIIANYYSLVGEHERAIQSYQRAVLLNPNYISAWTLMGHEFIELGNPHAAIETYRRAVDLAPYDFRPWFGLGQAYEILCMYFFALYYFQRALSLRPGDVRMWDSLGNCYEQLHKYTEAVSAFSQAHRISEGDVYYAYRLGMALTRVGKTDEALSYIVECALSNSAPAGEEDANLTAQAPEPGDEESEWPLRARMWLAKRAMSLGKWTEALNWARRIDHGTREMLDEARSLERESRVRAQSEA